MFNRVLLVFLLVVFGLAAAQPSEAQGRRVALVIGNSKYQNTPVLFNPGNDASDIASALRELRFEVVEGLDLSYEGMRRAVLAFSQKMEGADVGLLFYAGHGIQVSDRNYLVPVDAKLRHVRDIDLQLMELDKILTQMEREANIRIIFLDACRDNPLAEALAKSPVGPHHSVGRGLSQSVGAAESGTYIAFATKPGHVAGDGSGRNSPFTSSLKAHLRNSKSSIGEMMVDVRKEVAQATGNQQVPWDMSSLMSSFYFNRTDSPKPPTEPAANVAEAFVRSVWEDVRAANRIEIYRAFVDAFPNTIYAKLALGHIEALERSAPAQKAKKRAGTRTIGGAAAPGDLAQGGQAPETSDASLAKEPFRDCPECPLMIPVPAGSYLMGSPATEAGRQKNEGPQREVRVTRAFAVSVYEVTIAEYVACVEANKCKALVAGAVSSPSASLNALLDAQRPATNVSWEDAREYSLWLSAHTGWQYQLPSEAEWEYAARAGSSARYSWGDAVDPERVHCADCSGAEKRKYSTVIGQRPSNAFGVHDMLGNVWEWVADCWHKTYSNAEFSHWPWLERNEGDCSRRVLRGGSWANAASQLRSAYRLAGKTSSRGELIGFRVARVDAKQERIVKFLEQTYLMGGQQSLNEIKAYYCDKVDFYGRSGVSGTKVADEQLRQNKRWPYKSYVIIPGTLRIKPAGSTPEQMDVYFQYNYRVSKTPLQPEEMRPGAKKGETQLKLLVGEQQIRVCAEDGKNL